MGTGTRFWARAIARIIGNLRRSDFARELLTSGLRFDERLQLPERHIFDVFSNADTTVDLGAVVFRISNLDPLEQYVVALSAKQIQASTVFELGTFDGATTLLLAQNLPQADILTIDLPPESSSIATVASEARNAATGVGARFQRTVEARRIRQLYGDSRRFDFSPWYGQIDLVLVDAGHDYDCVKADTETAFRLVAPGGIVLWDDYQVGWPDVVRALHEVDDRRRSQMVHIACTDLVLYRNTPAPGASEVTNQIEA